MKMKKKAIWVISIFLILVTINVIFSGDKKLTGISEQAGEAIIEDVNSENINLTEISIKDDTITIAYDQPVEFKNEDLLANWAYIMISATNNMEGTVSKVSLRCDFENGDKILVNTFASNVIDLSEGKIDAEQFFSKVEIEPLTPGPEI